MFCSKCGKPLSDNAQFCSTCGAPVNTVQEGSSVLPQPAGTVGETKSIQMPKPAPFMEVPQFNGQIGYGVAASVQKKSKKGLVIGLSVGIAILLIAATAVVLAALGLFNPAPSSPFPVLEIGQTQIYYGENVDHLEEEFPNMEKITKSVYSLERLGDQSVACLVRTDKETGETKLVSWATTMNNTSLANGISIGDSYERISAEYPDAMCSTEMGYGSPAHKYNPETDPRVSFSVYMNESGNTYSPLEYQKKRNDSIRAQENFDIAKWYLLSFTVENSQITEIVFGDLIAIQAGH